MTGIGQRYEEKERKAVALTKAQDLVNSVDRLSKNGNYSHAEACRLLDFTEDAYFVAKEYIELAEKKEPVAV